MPRIRVAACQINTVVGDLDGNVDRMLGALAEAGGAGADLAVFPELTVTGYPPEALLGRPAFVEDNLAAFATVAAATGECAAVVGYVDVAPSGRLLNAAALCHRGQVVAVVEPLVERHRRDAQPLGSPFCQLYLHRRDVHGRHFGNGAGDVARGNCRHLSGFGQRHQRAYRQVRSHHHARRRPR